MKKSKRVSLVMLVALLTIGMFFGNTDIAMAAITSMKVDENEYNVYVEDYPSSVTTIYAKFNAKKSDVELYALSLYDDYESEEVVANALAKSGDNIDNYELIAMDVALYKEEDDDFYPVTASTEMTIICEVPYEFEDLESKVKIFMVNDSGNIETIPYTLVEVDDVICMQFTIKKFTKYAFALSVADREAYENADDDDDTTPIVTPVATKAPTATPAPTNVAQSSNTSSNTSSNSSNTVQKDRVPQTGDDFSAAKTSTALFFAGAFVVTVVWYMKKK